MNLMTRLICVLVSTAQFKAPKAAVAKSALYAQSRLVQLCIGCAFCVRKGWVTGWLILMVYCNQPATSTTSAIPLDYQLKIARVCSLLCLFFTDYGNEACPLPRQARQFLPFYVHIVFLMLGLEHRPHNYIDMET